VTLRAQNLSWTRGGNLIVDGVSIRPEPGQTVGLLGPNGSGKSSLLRLLAGISRPDQGTVTLDDTPLHRLGRRPLARRIAMVGQHAHTEVDITVRDVVRLGRATCSARIRTRIPRSNERCMLPGSPNTLSAPGAAYRVGNGNGPRSHGRWRKNPGNCCSTSRPITSISRTSSIFSIWSHACRSPV
jgi:ABC-type multidrug transport system fused ATPase/permease subunit